MEEDNSFSLLKFVKKKTKLFSQAQRTKATTETSNTSKESSEPQLLGAGKI